MSTVHEAYNATPDLFEPEAARYTSQFGAELLGLEGDKLLDRVDDVVRGWSRMDEDDPRLPTLAMLVRTAQATGVYAGMPEQSSAWRIVSATGQLNEAELEQFGQAVGQVDKLKTEGYGAEGIAEYIRNGLDSYRTMGGSQGGADNFELAVRAFGAGACVGEDQAVAAGMQDELDYLIKQRTVQGY